MKKLLLIGAVAVGMMTGYAALAIPISGTIQGWQNGDGTSYSDGGQFTALVDGSISFQTYCIEIYNEFSPGSVYQYNLGQTTHGDPNLGGPSSPLQLGTAWLFSQWNSGAFGTLQTGFVPGEFQAALWYFQSQGANPNGAYNQWNNGIPNGDIYTQDALIALGASAFSDSNGAYGVQVIEVVNGQDWLYVPDGGATVMLLGAALTAIGLLRRKLIA